VDRHALVSTRRLEGYSQDNHDIDTETMVFGSWEPENEMSCIKHARGAELYFKHAEAVRQMERDGYRRIKTVVAIAPAKDGPPKTYSTKAA